MCVQRYAELQSSLSKLSSQRELARQQLGQYERLQQMLEPFKNPQQTLQPNLVTRDGDLGRELDRSRILMARLAERIARLDQADNGRRAAVAEAGDEALTEQQKLAKLL